MTLEDALDEAMRVFFDDDESDDLSFYEEDKSKNKYTKKYFDEVEEELLPKGDEDTKKNGTKRRL